MKLVRGRKQNLVLPVHLQQVETGGVPPDTGKLRGGRVDSGLTGPESSNVP